MCKNWSDLATGMIRGSWYSLPMPARIPQALVVQQINFLLTTNIMKIWNTITYRGTSKSREDIDKFRNRKNKLVGSYRGFIMELRKQCIVPAMRKEQARKERWYEFAYPSEPELFTTPTRAAELSTNLEIEPRRTCSSSRREVVSFSYSNQIIRLQGNSPPNSTSGTEDGHKRQHNCETPSLTFLCKKNGKKSKGKCCGLCKRITIFYCVGCHQ